MSNKSVKRNIVFQTIYQVLIVLTPLATSPYVARVLGAEKLGIYSYTLSIANYFVILAMLGTNIYGSKTIARVRDNLELRSRTFSEIITLQVILALIGCAIYSGIILSVEQEDLLVSALQMLMIVSCMFNINWLFFGLEEIKTAVVRNVIIKVVTMTCIFTLIRSSDDLWLYVIIMAGGEVASQAALVVLARKHVSYRLPTFRGVAQHIKPNLLLFAPGIAYAVNADLDKTMIGIYSDFTNSGCYYNADKLIRVPLGVITGIGMVMLPHVTNMAASKGGGTDGKVLKRTFQSIMLIAVALSMGIVAVAKEFVPVFFGAGYDECVNLIYIMCFTLIFKTVANIAKTQYLIPNNMDKTYSKVLLAGTLFNCLLNIALIPRFGARGAAVATMVAELAICATYIAIIHRQTHIGTYVLRSCIYIVPAVAMCGAVRVLTAAWSLTGIAQLAAEIIIGGALYLAIAVPCLFMIDKEAAAMIKGMINGRLKSKVAK